MLLTAGCVAMAAVVVAAAVVMGIAIMMMAESAYADGLTGETCNDIMQDGACNTVAAVATPRHAISSVTPAVPPVPVPSQWSLFSEDPSLFGTGWQYGSNLHASMIVKVDPEFFSENADHTLKRYMIFGTNTVHNVGGGSGTGPAALPNGGLFYRAVMSEASVSELSSMGFLVMEDRPLDFHVQQASYDGDRTAGNFMLLQHSMGAIHGNDDTAHPDATGIRAIAGLDGTVHEATGSGITIAVVDTGVDFSNPDIRHSLARNHTNNHPLMLDPDGQGIVLTNGTFIANIDEHGTIHNYTGPLPDGYDSSVYVTDDGVFLDIRQDRGMGTTIPVYNPLFPAVGSVPVFNGTLEHDMRIGNNGQDYIRSQSGTYRLGVIYQLSPPGPSYDPVKAQVVPVLVVDSGTAGIYDTIVPDMSTSWLDYTYVQGENLPDFDFDFTDEDAIILGSGNEFLLYDSDGDGVVDYTAGAAGARVLDIYSVMNASRISHHDDAFHAVNGTLLPGLDPDGRFFGIMTDFVGHGTSSAATVVSGGSMTYDIYNDTGSHVIRGVAPDAAILPVKSLWLGDAIYGWLWAAGFDNNGDQWTFSGDVRADIITNSWGISAFPVVGSSPGRDVTTLAANMLATPRSLHDDYPGVLMVVSSGNSGHGYGTIGTPSAASLGMSVGASTNNVFVGYGPFKGQPRFGNDTVHHSHMVDFSSRGPGSIGDPKPDIISLGAFGFVPGPMTGASSDMSVADPFTLFGGTSMAAPLVAGAAAVIMEKMTDRLLDYDPFVIKNIIMSTAEDMHNDPFVQGAGLAHAGRALDFVNGDNGVFVVYNDDSYDNIRQILVPAAESVNFTGTGIMGFDLPWRQIPMTSWFAGHLEASDRTSAIFTVENTGSSDLAVQINPQTFHLMKQTSYNGSTVVQQQDSVLNEDGVFAPNYIRLADVQTHDGLGGLFDDTFQFPDGAELLILTVNFAFDDFMNATAPVYADDLRIASLYLYDWVDKDGDSHITSDELVMITRGGSWGTVQEIRVSDPAEKFDGVPMVGIYPVPERFSYWLGRTGANATSFDYTVSAGYYAKDRWDAVWPESSNIVVPAGGTASMDVTLVVPDEAVTGAYQGFVSFEGDAHTVNVPVSFVVKEVVDSRGSEFVIGRPGPGSNADGSDGPAHGSSGNVMYGNGHTRGAFDMSNRYMAGEWNQYHFDVRDEDIDTALVELSWESEKTSLSVFVMDPAGKIIQSNVSPGAFGHFLDWPSADWLGPSPFSEGGGFYPSTGGLDGGTTTALGVTINGTGTYTILTHTTLFGGESVTEPVTLNARFVTTTEAEAAATVAVAAATTAAATTEAEAAATVAVAAATTTTEAESRPGPESVTRNDTAAAISATDTTVQENAGDGSESVTDANVTSAGLGVDNGTDVGRTGTLAESQVGTVVNGMSELQLPRDKTDQAAEVTKFVVLSSPESSEPLLRTGPDGQNRTAVANATAPPVNTAEPEGIRPGAEPADYNVAEARDGVPAKNDDSGTISQSPSSQLVTGIAIGLAIGIGAGVAILAVLRHKDRQ